MLFNWINKSCTRSKQSLVAFLVLCKKWIHDICSNLLVWKFTSVFWLVL